MRLVPALIGILTLCAAGSAGAQIKSAVNQPTLPQPTVLQDTILISTFDLVQASSGGFQLKATILGLAPQGYRVSAYRDFRDQSTFLAWPSSNVPAWQTSQTAGSCGANTVKIVGFFQVRAKKSTGKFVSSTVARDSVCITFG